MKVYTYILEPESRIEQVKIAERVYTSFNDAKQAAYNYYHLWWGSNFIDETDDGFVVHFNAPSDKIYGKVSIISFEL